MALFSGPAVPAYSLGIIFRYTLAFVIPKPEVELRWGMALFSGLPVPAYSLGIIFWHTLAFAIHTPEAELR